MLLSLQFGFVAPALDRRSAIVSQAVGVQLRVRSGSLAPVQKHNPGSQSFATHGTQGRRPGRRWLPGDCLDSDAAMSKSSPVGEHFESTDHVQFPVRTAAEERLQRLRKASTEVTSPWRPRPSTARQSHCSRCRSMPHPVFRSFLNATKRQRTQCTAAAVPWSAEPGIAQRAWLVWTKELTHEQVTFTGHEQGDNVRSATPPKNQTKPSPSVAAACDSINGWERRSHPTWP